jgi:NADP-dependent 3-hydroxy acid dehydrogenase YdfG
MKPVRAYVPGMNTAKGSTIDKVVVITGASAGIGAELAKQLARRGAKVVLAARRKAELEGVAKELGDNALAVVTDVTKRDDVDHLGQAALDRFGRIDVWVNNAGRGISRSVAELTDEDLDGMWRDNMKSVVYGIQAVLPHFKSRNEARSSISRAACRACRSPRFAPLTGRSRAR